MVRPAKFEISEQTDPERVTLAVVGELDMSTIVQLSERVGAHLTRGASRLTLDLCELSFMDSSGLRLLIELSDRSRRDGWELSLIAPRHHEAALVLRATGADLALPFLSRSGSDSATAQDAGPGDPSALRIDLPRDLQAPATARAAINGFCRGRDLSTDAVATLTLLVSEVVTNAVVHPEAESHRTITLRASVRTDAVRVEVSDSGRRFTPRPRDPDRTDGGYGLYLVDKEAARWGLGPGPTTTVWFEVESSTG